MGQLMSPSTGASRAAESLPARIASYAPATGALLGEVAVSSPDEVRAAVERARRAQPAWAALSVEERGERLLRYRDAVVERQDELVELLSAETGKPRHEALLHEVVMVADLATYFARVAPKALAPREVPLHLMKHRQSRVHYTPKGVIGVISPWNFPLQLPLRDVLSALVAGNAVVLKPSEITPLIAAKAKELWDDAGLPADLFQVVQGFGATGAALIDAGIQACLFTGGVATGRRVAAACGERLIPCVMELGGKAPLVACADADLELTAKGIVFGAFANSGQVCISVERVYAHESIHDRLLARVVELTRSLRQGDPLGGADVEVGAITFPHQITVAERHVADALAKGAKLEAGGKRREGRGQFFEPTVLSGCDHSMTVMTQEIFGPIVPFARVWSDEEAVRLSNDSHLGLNAYVFTRDVRKGARIAEQIQAGSVLVNDVLANGGTADAPFGGIKQSGFGRVLGEESLRDVCDVKHVSVPRVGFGGDLLWYPYDERKYDWFRRTTRALFSGGGLLGRLGQLL
jgi:acyl-CoA reductase-like NAD-dependent aldehyde dehydrogenase